MEVRNRFKGLDLIDKVPDELWTQVCDTVQEPGIETIPMEKKCNKAKIDAFLELSCFFDDPADVGNLISGSSAFSKISLNIWKFMVHSHFAFLHFFSMGMMLIPVSCTMS